MECKSSKLLGDLNMEKGIEKEEIKEIELKLEKLKIPKIIINAIRKLVIPEKYLYYILKLDILKLNFTLIKSTRVYVIIHY